MGLVLFKPKVKCFYALIRLGLKEQAFIMHTFYNHAAHSSLVDHIWIHGMKATKHIK